jgi:hypothetical protein
MHLTDGGSSAVEFAASGCCDTAAGAVWAFGSSFTEVSDGKDLPGRRTSWPQVFLAQTSPSVTAAGSSLWTFTECRPSTDRLT